MNTSGSTRKFEEKAKLPITAIILTYNEEYMIRGCLESLKPLAIEIIVVDSGSTDATLAIAKEYTDHIYLHQFENYGKQRNWALEHLPIKTEWVLNLDADHRITTKLVQEIWKAFSTPVSLGVDGFLTSRKTIFLGKWIRFGGHYPTYHCVLFRLGKGKCEEKLYDQHFIVDGRTLKLKGDVIDNLTENISSFIDRHNRWAALEADDQFFRLSRTNTHLIKGSIRGNSIQIRRYFKSLYERFPLFVRPTIYFVVRYFFRLGFLDGGRGLIFHILQGFWFRFLVDSKIYELRNSRNSMTARKGSLTHH